VPQGRGVGLLGLVVAALVLTGCASTVVRRTSQVGQLDLGSLTNATAYLERHGLWLRFPLSGKDAYAHAEWPAPETARVDYCHRVAALQLTSPELGGRRAAVRNARRVGIQSVRAWQELTQTVFQDVVPSGSGQGVLLLLHNQEVVIYRNEPGALQVTRLEALPAQVTLRQTLNTEGFARRAMESIDATLGEHARGERQHLLATGEDPAFVFFDLDQRLVVFLHQPVNPEARTGDAPPGFVMRTLHSVFVRSLLVTLVKNPVTFLNRGLWHIGHSGATALDAWWGSPRLPVPPVSQGPGMDLAQWERDLDQLVSSRRYPGHLRFLIDGEAFFPEFIQSIQRAARSIDLQVYIFDNDDYGVRLADLLRARSQAVRVRVLFDELGTLFGSRNLPDSPLPPDFVAPRDIGRYLAKGSRVQVRKAANPWLTVEHTKCMVIDGREAFLGGMNLGREYRFDWHDLMVGLTGPIVGRLQKDFAKAWAHAGPLGDYAHAWISVFDRENPPPPVEEGSIDVRPLYTKTGVTEIYLAQMEAIRRARHYIFIENPYFVDDSVLRELVSARRRGVDVRVVLPARNDSGIMGASNQVTANHMVQHGIRVYAYPGMTHVKAAIYDGWACLGSANFGKISLRIGRELNVAFSDAKAVVQLKRDLFETDFARSREITQPLPVSWTDSLVEVLANQF
jgi:cardiolipin synthase